jgi:mRNA interferase MazF
MTDYQTGEVVLVSFLFTSGTASKRRPGLILLDTGDRDIIIARITGQGSRTNFDVEIVEWQKAGLLQPSVVRVDKLNTLEKRLIERSLGRVEASDWQNVRTKIQQLWSSI